MLWIDVPPSQFGMNDRRPPPEQRNPCQGHPHAHNLFRHEPIPLSEEGENAACLVLFFRNRECIRLAIRWVADHLYVASFRPHTGSHADMHVNSIIAYVIR